MDRRERIEVGMDRTEEPMSKLLRGALLEVRGQRDDLLWFIRSVAMVSSVVFWVCVLILAGWKFVGLLL